MDKKEAYLFCKFLEIERKKIDEDKWYEGERKHCDPGQEYVIDWIEKNAKNWREYWDASSCKHCYHWMECGQLVKIECSRFNFDEKEREE